LSVSLVSIKVAEMILWPGDGDKQEGIDGE
jgi:hypothetical protein